MAVGDAAEGFKAVGQSIDLWGEEDSRITREAFTFWNETRYSRHINMRERVNKELFAVAGHVDSGELTWSKAGVQRLICEYPYHKKLTRCWPPLVRMPDTTSSRTSVMTMPQKTLQKTRQLQLRLSHKA